MRKYISEEHHRAADLMAEARKILFRALHAQIESRKTLAEGLEKLGLAFEFVEDPLGKILLCPNCDGFCLEKTAQGKNMCLSCDYEWTEGAGDCHAEGAGGYCHAEH